MKYLLTDYDRDQFNQLDDLVRLCYYNPLNGRWGFPWTQLSQIGTSLEGLEDDNARYIESNNSPSNTLNGVCFHNRDYFKVWLNPDMASGDLLFELTLIHELCHGYMGPVMHSLRWREFYGMAIIMYAHLLNPAFTNTDPEWQLKHTIRRYRNEEEDKNKLFAEHLEASNLELERTVGLVERNINRVTRDFKKLQEMRTCQRSTSNTTPTPAYLASLPKKVGTALPLK